MSHTTITPLSEPTRATAQAALQVETPSHVSHGTKERQARFLELFGKFGQVTATAEATGIDRVTHYDWIKRDINAYRVKFDAAQQVWREALESRAMARIDDPQGNRGSDVLLLAMLNASWPDKYRPGVIVADDTAKDLLAELRKRGRRVKPESSI
jgi:hypothetical protein